MTRRESTSCSASARWQSSGRSRDLSIHSHEELYHNSEDTQTDESYTHPEDIKHFANHEKIEAEEEALALKAQGLPADPEIEKLRGASPDEVAAAALGQEPPAKQAVFDAAERARLARAAAAQSQANKYRAAAAEASKRGPWSEDFKRPRDKADKLRVGVPCVSFASMLRLTLKRVEQSEIQDKEEQVRTHANPCTPLPNARTVSGAISEPCPASCTTTASLVQLGSSLCMAATGLLQIRLAMQ
jgi:hypothetical protein